MMRFNISVVTADYNYRYLQSVKRIFPKNFEIFVNNEEYVMLYTMMQVCKETNMTYQALKFYCNEGLVPHVKRDRNNRRVFDERDVAWIKSLTRGE